MSRAIKTTPEMAQEMATEREKSGYNKKLYKVASDEYKGEILANDIINRATDLIKSQERGKVNFNDLEDVEGRAYAYLQACADSQTFPSVMGLAVHGFGISRQALNQYITRNPDSRATDFINRVKDVIADILTNASLNNNANAVQAIFQLKNHFDHSDKVEIQPIPADPLSSEHTMTDEECIALIKSAHPNEDISGITAGELQSKALAIKYDVP